MSRAQEATATDTAASQNQGYYTNAQNSYANAQAAEGTFEKSIGTLAASDPFKPGGVMQKTTNQQLTDTADATSAALGNTLQGAALRTGENTSGAVAATEDAQQQAQRTLGSQEAAATQARVTGEAGFQKNLLDANAQPVQAETTLSGQQASAAGGALGNQIKAADTPSWTDEFGNAVANTLGGKNLSAAYKIGG